MKRLGLLWISKKQIHFEFWVQQFEWKKNRERVSRLFLLQECYFFVEHFNIRKKIHGRLKACEIFSCVKFICEIHM